MMPRITRWLRHLFMPPWAWRSAFPKATLDAIEAAIAAGEATHGGEIRFAIENSLPAILAWRGMPARERAIEVFSNLGVWDTEHNSGVLVYLLLADHDIEIVADRGVAARVDDGAWETIAHAMEAAFRQGDFERGALEGVHGVSALLAAHFPPLESNPDELRNRPVIV